MNFNKFINSDYLKENPLCGIDTYKDELNLTTGVCTRQIKKLVLTGDESDWRTSGSDAAQIFNHTIGLYADLQPYAICNMFHQTNNAAGYNNSFDIVRSSGNGVIRFNNSGIASTTAAWKTYLQQQYANGTPVTVWYVLAIPTTEVITVPSGLSGTVEGYLNQSGTPTPTNPIYPTANTVEQWFDLNHYIMGTDTDTITTLPAVLYPTGTTATVGLKGQTVQNGTPTTQNPIIPQGTGERTGNLTYKIIENANISAEGLIASASGYNVMVAKVAQGQAYSGTGYVYAFFNDEPDIRSTSYNESRVVNNFRNVTAPISGYVAVRYAPSENPMLNTGSTALPFEPYGYKIPISSANITTPVYLGEVETERKIKKYEITGQESDLKKQATITATNAIQFPTTLSDYKRENFICSHMPLIDSSTNPNTHGYAGQFLTLCFDLAMGLDTLEKVRTYLQQQYAAGTPVTVWYVLATPETAVVNEPLMKIGDYADEVSNVSIPVTAGGDTLSVDTTVQPSEVTVNYKGWHPVQSAHEKSRNLFDGVLYEGFYNDNGQLVIDTSNGCHTNLIKANTQTTYTVSNLWTTSFNFAVYEWDANKQWLRRTNRQVPSGNEIRFTLNNDCAYFSLQINSNYDYTRLMLNEGSTALPYEPYWN